MYEIIRLFRSGRSPMERDPCRKISLRLAIAALFGAGVMSFVETAKGDPRWCAISHEGASNCSFNTMDQCRAEVSGLGGYCVPRAPVGHRQPTEASIEAARKAAGGAR